MQADKKGEPHTDISHYDEKHSHKVFSYLMDGVLKKRKNNGKVIS